MDRLGNENGQSSGSDSDIDSSESMSNRGSGWHVLCGNYCRIFLKICFTELVIRAFVPARTEHNQDDYGSWNYDSQSVIDSQSIIGSDLSDDTIMLPGGVLAMIQIGMNGGTRQSGSSMRCTISLPSLDKLDKVMPRSIMTTMMTVAMTIWTTRRSPV